MTTYTCTDYEEFIQDPYTDKMIDRMLKDPGDWMKFITKQSKIIKDNKDNKGYYEYFITFTIDPKKQDITDYITIEHIEDYIKSLIYMKQIEAIQWWLSIEHIDTNPHWHCMVQSKKIIKKDYFRTYQKIYGRIDLEKITVGTSDRVINYMSKENTPINLLA